jgi:signal transduction histidine kinase
MRAQYGMVSNQVFLMAHGTSIRKSRIIWFTLAGMLLGYLLVHPFAMLANTLGPRLSHIPMEFPFWGHHLQVSFAPEMLAMGGAFAFMGGLAGFFFGIWYYQKEKLTAQRLESQRQHVALETLQELMVTLSHHIRNANVVIGGFSSRMIKNLPDPEVQRQCNLIQQASQEIEAVIASLESLSHVDRTRYIGEWETRMIDLKKALEARLAAFESSRDVP